MPSSRPNLAALFLGMQPTFSIPKRIKAGTAIKVASMAREAAVCMTAFFAAICDLPRLSCVSGLGMSMPRSSSHCLMHKLLATPPIELAHVATPTFTKSNLAPTARLVISVNASLIPIESGIEVQSAAMKPFVTSHVVWGDVLVMLP